MENVIYTTEHKKNNLLIAIFVYLFIDIIYLGFISFIVFIVYKISLNSDIQFTNIIPFILIIIVVLYGYFKRKRLHVFHIPAIIIEKNGNILLNGYKNLSQFKKSFNILESNYYLLVDGNLINATKYIIFEIDNQIIYCWNDSEALYEILHENFPQVELPKKKTISII